MGRCCSQLAALHKHVDLQALVAEYTWYIPGYDVWVIHRRRTSLSLLSATLCRGGGEERGRRSTDRLTNRASGLRYWRLPMPRKFQPNRRPYGKLTYNGPFRWVSFQWIHRLGVLGGGASKDVTPGL